MANEQASATNEKPKRSIQDFFRETQREVAKVTWPTRKEIYLTTALIIVFALVTGVFFLLVDSCLGFAVSRILGMNA